PFRQVQTILSNQRCTEGKLSNSVPGQHELADAQNPNAELANTDNSTSELPDADNATLFQRCPVRPIFERVMDKGQARNGGLGLVLVPPTIPRLPSRVGRAALWTGEGLL